MVDATIRALVRISRSNRRLVSEHVAEYMAENGYMHIDVVPDALLIGDGADSRPVYWIGGQAYAQSAEDHRLKTQAAIMQKVQIAREKERSASDRPGESLSAVLCPACRAIMAKSPICPNCTKGKQGFKILCICTDCGHEVYL